MVEGDGSRAVQVLPDENFPHGAVQVGHLNAVGSRVRPVDLSADSIHCQTISRHQAYRERDAERRSNDTVAGWSQTRRYMSATLLTCRYDLFLCFPVDAGSTDFLQCAVRPVNFTCRKVRHAHVRTSTCAVLKRAF